MGANWTGGVADRRGDGSPTVDEWRPVADGDGAAAFRDAAGDGAATLEGAADDGAAAPADAADGGDAPTPIAYRTTIADPRGDAAQRALLELRGVPPGAEIWLDGERVETRSLEFGPFRTTFEPPSDGECELIVRCERPPSLAAVAPEPARVAARLDAETRTRPPTFCRRLEARPRLTDDGGVIDVEIEVDADRAVADAVTLSVRPEGFRGGATMQRVPVEADAGERVVVTESLEVREPALWWPAGYGPQHRYAVQAKLGADSAATTVAFRRVDRDGDDLLVNGEPVRLRGFTRRAGGDPVTDVRRAAEANANLLRARGHVPAESFYAACDEAGILVWQDVPADVTGASAGEDGAPSDVVTELTDALEDAYGHRPSFGIYGLADESGGEAPVDGLTGSGLATKLRFRYRTWRTDPLGEPPEAVVDAVAGERPVISSVGPPGTDADAAALFPGWRYLAGRDIDWLLERDPELGRLVGAFGAGSLAEGDVDPADVDGLDATILEDRFGTDPDPDPEESRTAQAHTLKTVAEALRRRGSTLLAAETLRDRDDGGGTGVLTADGATKPAYESLADSFEPVQAVLEGPAEPGSVGIVLCNDTRDPLEATVAWEAGGAAGETAVTVEPLETADAGTAEIPPDADRLRLTVTADDRTVTSRYRL